MRLPLSEWRLIRELQTGDHAPSLTTWITNLPLMNDAERSGPLGRGRLGHQSDADRAPPR